ncbi:DUF255 domain-containing protein [Halovivax limisalsi]|uniref:DUF255 domain-containing protein n=1 Tax=Halovivax limisalsi TaxID=1453760 RepID=UPI001FFCA302|nr:DUF255 domain-containing protein [Halovivax limisalsi]
MSAESRVEWREWGPRPFVLAESTDRPILLSLTASWCRPCASMDATTYADPRIAASINDRFVPVRVDADRRPRVRDRYNAGGFPSTVFLTPDGEIIEAVTYLDPDALRSTLDHVESTWQDRGDAAGTVPETLPSDGTPKGTLAESILDRAYQTLRSANDERAGGWGGAPKFPLPAAIEFLLGRDDAMAQSALDAVRTGLASPDGGFYRFAHERDWSDPQREIRLEDTAALIRAFANAYLHTGAERYRSTAERAIEFATGTLWVEPSAETGRNDGAFANAVAGDATDDADFDADRGRSIDRTVYAGVNGLAIDALSSHAAYTDHERAREFAQRALATVRHDLLEDGVVDHRLDAPRDEATRCLLADQTRVCRALLSARSVFGWETIPAARRVADVTIDRLRDEETGSVLDGPRSETGLLSRPLRPLEANAELASVLLDLSVLTGEEAYRADGRAILEAFAGASDTIGVRSCGYPSAVGRYLHDPLIVRVGAPAGSDLHRAAFRVADHRKIVVPNAPSVPDDAARVERGDRRSEPARSPAELVSRVESVST